MSEVTIIGGGLAGAASAVWLAQQGITSCLLEKQNTAHHKICGEFISIEACSALQALGVNLVELGAVPITQLRLVCGVQQTVIALPFRAMSVSRKSLDTSLLDVAAQAGVTVQQGVTVKGLTPYLKSWHLATSTGEIISKKVLLASGKHTMRGWARDINGTLSDATGFKMHFRLPNVEPLANTVELYLFNGGYVGLEPIEEGKVNLCMVVNRRFLNYCGNNWSGIMAELSRILPLLSQQLTNAIPCWDKPLTITAIPYGYVYRPQSGETSPYRLGDQMAVIPSFCGDGMAIALHTAKLATNALLQGHSSVEYHHHARTLLTPQIRRAVWLNRFINYPLNQHLLIATAMLFPTLIAHMARLTRVRLMKY